MINANHYPTLPTSTGFKNIYHTIKGYEQSDFFSSPSPIATKLNKLIKLIVLRIELFVDVIEIITSIPFHLLNLIIKTLFFCTTHFNFNLKKAKSEFVHSLLILVDMSYIKDICRIAFQPQYYADSYRWWINSEENSLQDDFPEYLNQRKHRTIFQASSSQLNVFETLRFIERNSGFSLAKTIGVAIAGRVLFLKDAIEGVVRLALNIARLAYAFIALVITLGQNYKAREQFIDALYSTASTSCSTGLALIGIVIGGGVSHLYQKLMDSANKKEINPEIVKSNLAVLTSQLRLLNSMCTDYKITYPKIKEAESSIHNYNALYLQTMFFKDTLTNHPIATKLTQEILAPINMFIKNVIKQNQFKKNQVILEQIQLIRKNIANVIVCSETDLMAEQFNSIQDELDTYYFTHITTSPELIDQSRIDAFYRSIENLRSKLLPVQEMSYLVGPKLKEMETLVSNTAFSNTPEVHKKQFISQIRKYCSKRSADDFLWHNVKCPLLFKAFTETFEQSLKELPSLIELDAKLRQDADSLRSLLSSKILKSINTSTYKESTLFSSIIKAINSLLAIKCTHLEDYQTIRSDLQTISEAVNRCISFTREDATTLFRGRKPWSDVDSMNLLITSYLEGVNKHLAQLFALEWNSLDIEKHLDSLTLLRRDIIKFADGYEKFLAHKDLLQDVHIKVNKLAQKEKILFSNSKLFKILSIFISNYQSLYTEFFPTLRDHTKLTKTVIEELLGKLDLPKSNVINNLDFYRKIDATTQSFILTKVDFEAWGNKFKTPLFLHLEFYGYLLSQMKVKNVNNLFDDTQEENQPTLTSIEEVFSKFTILSTSETQQEAVSKFNHTCENVINTAYRLKHLAMIFASLGMLTPSFSNRIIEVDLALIDILINFNADTIDADLNKTLIKSLITVCNDCFTQEVKPKYFAFFAKIIRTELFYLMPKTYRELILANPHNSDLEITFFSSLAILQIYSRSINCDAQEKSKHQTHLRLIVDQINRQLKNKNDKKLLLSIGATIDARSFPELIELTETSMLKIFRKKQQEVLALAQTLPIETIIVYAPQLNQFAIQKLKVIESIKSAKTIDDLHDCEIAIDQLKEKLKPELLLVWRDVQRQKLKEFALSISTNNAFDKDGFPLTPFPYADTEPHDSNPTRTLNAQFVLISRINHLKSFISEEPNWKDIKLFFDYYEKYKEILKNDSWIAKEFLAFC